MNQSNSTKGLAEHQQPKTILPKQQKMGNNTEKKAEEAFFHSRHFVLQ